MAGSIFSRLPLCSATMRASCRVVAMGPRVRSATIPRAIFAAIRSSPNSRKIRVSSSTEAVATMSAALRPLLPMRMSSGPSRRNENPRSASSSCIEETPRSARIAVGRRVARRGRDRDRAKSACDELDAVAEAARGARARARARRDRGRCRAGGSPARARGAPRRGRPRRASRPRRSRRAPGASSSTTSSRRTGVCARVSIGSSPRSPRSRSRHSSSFESSS